MRKMRAGSAKRRRLCLILAEMLEVDAASCSIVSVHVKRPQVTPPSEQTNHTRVNSTRSARSEYRKLQYEKSSTQQTTKHQRCTPIGPV